jgi:hypothetical protein
MSLTVPTAAKAGKLTGEILRTEAMTTVVKRKEKNFLDINFSSSF